MTDLFVLITFEEWTVGKPLKISPIKSRKPNFDSKVAIKVSSNDVKLKGWTCLVNKLQSEANCS